MERIEPDYKAAFGHLAYLVSGAYHATDSKDRDDLLEEAYWVISCVYNSMLYGKL